VLGVVPGFEHRTSARGYLAVSVDWRRDTMPTRKQTEAAKKNVRKAAAAAKDKRSLAHMCRRHRQSLAKLHIH
jgi:hypothetical protein